MGRSPCCEKEHTNKGAWTKEEDERLINYIKAHGEGCWRSLPKAAALSINNNKINTTTTTNKNIINVKNTILSKNSCSTNLHIDTGAANYTLLTQPSSSFIQVLPAEFMTSNNKNLLPNNSSNIYNKNNKLNSDHQSSAEDSNSSSGVTTELEVYRPHPPAAAEQLINLELSIGLPPPPSHHLHPQIISSSTSHPKHQQHHQQQIKQYHQVHKPQQQPSFGASVVAKQVCFSCCLGFKKGQTCGCNPMLPSTISADSLYRYYTSLDS
ncbi:hypothetical protein Tsubulata_025261 [Turnera subulata]|uniref:Myb-like domain-containing protein n=1 Tax=Turnera subulata TaxID=218843 RepID=A0A9Q0G8V6_9ROSI|nr:hypothetical protein Tsubulata_025261 [Turnera subulata]